MKRNRKTVIITFLISKDVFDEELLSKYKTVYIPNKTKEQFEFEVFLKKFSISVCIGQWNSNS